uniref:PDZ and LIM domain protein 3 n=1 Tax=Phallusia mammillata TaxID=59560 RepID=A0A6F9DMU9_9ASCI|nr:PDZ and LIM domain protein 3 [Phallusia mammillata]
MPQPRIQSSVTLFGSPPWGFRMSGGKEFNQPLVITRITPGSVAAKSGLASGDVLITVNGQFAGEMTQDECEAKVKQAVGSLYLVVEKNAAKVTQLPSGEVSMEADRSIYATRHAGTSHNRTAQGYRPTNGPPTAPRPVKAPFVSPTQVPVFDPSALKKTAAQKHGAMVMKGPGKSRVVHAQYNTPMGMYSNDNIIDTVQAQAQSMGVSLPGAGDDTGTGTPLDPNSAVYREVHRQEANPRGKTTQSRSFKMLESIVQPGDVDAQ